MLRILGVDPGTVKAGWAIVPIDLTCKEYGIWKADKASLPIEERLGSLLEEMEIKFGNYVMGGIEENGEFIVQQVPLKPEFNILAVESQFFGQNAKTALRLAEAKGIILALAGKYGIPVIEVPPTLIKKIATGHGGSGKATVARMITGILEIKEEIQYDDITDAMAIAYAVAHRISRTKTFLKNVKLWPEDYTGVEFAKIVRKAWKKIKLLRV